MDQRILDFIKTQRTGVLAVEMLDGSPHGATVHFANTEITEGNPLEFYFETYREYRKAEPLFGRPKSRASFVIGTDEATMKTLQLDGEVMLIGEDEKVNYDKVYFGKFPNKIEKAKDPKFVFFKFIPTWWRYTDWNGGNGKIIITS